MEFSLFCIFGDIKYTVVSLSIKLSKQPYFITIKWPDISKTVQDYDKGYYDGLVGSRIRAFDWHQNQRPWTAETSLLQKLNGFSEPTRKIWLKVDTGRRQNVGQWFEFLEI